MTQINFGDALKAQAKPYETRMSGSPSDAREALALADLYIRAAYTLVVMGSHSDGGPALHVASTPGVGVMLAAVRGVARWGVAAHERWNRTCVRQLASSVASRIDAFRVGTLYTSFKTLRDRFSHGSPLPADNSEANGVALALRNLCDGLRDTILVAFGSCRLAMEGGNTQLILSGKEAAFIVSPLWVLVGSESSAGLYSHSGAEHVYYLVPGGGLIRVKADDLASSARGFLPERSAGDPTLGRFVRDVVNDVGAFTEDNSSPSYYFGDDANAGHLFVPWTRPTSEANEPRVDVFRIGPDYQRQWLGTTWQPYSAFLRHVVNWPLLARRVRVGLDQFAQQRGEEEKSRFGSLTADDVQGPSHLIEVSESLEHADGRPKLALSQRADDACQSFKPSTTVFFIVGQAGLGKTQLMLTLAQDRASEIERQSENLKPLYLFVSSTGRTLASLDDAVNSALNITKLLSSQGAKALCRNGLVVLLVDGFDELLGSSGYENALGSLEPWFRELGGRGVLIASARSSYYLTQYRRSLSETTGLNVDHTLAEIQPWSKPETERYLRERGIPDSRWQKLGNRDWLLLGIPFFAKAFAAWHDRNERGGGSIRSIFDIVVEQYLHRESSKLRDPHQGPLLGPEELKDLFAEIAETMFLSKSRELELTDLVNCAQLAIGADSLDDARPGLLRRLSALCGLDANQTTPGTAKSSNLSFSHEVMFDCFLSLALQRRIARGSLFGVPSFLEKGKVHQAVFDWLVEQATESARKAMAKLLIDFQGWPSEPLADNLGSLWMSLLTFGNGVPPTHIVKGLHLGDLELSGDGWTNLTVDSCRIEGLLIPAAGRCSISVPNSRIRVVRCNNGSRLAETLKDVDPSLVQEILLKDVYVDTPYGVRLELEKHGAVPRLAYAADRKRQDAAEYFLDKLTTRVDVQVIVYADDHLADNDRLRWTRRLGDDAWLDFVSELVRSDLARWEPIRAGGAPKVRLIFEVPPALIARRDSTDDRVSSFWGALRGPPIG